MTAPAFGVIPEHKCWRCSNSGWVTVTYDNGDVREFPCPEGCPQPELPPVEDP